MNTYTTTNQIVRDRIDAEAERLYNQFMNIINANQQAQSKRQLNYIFEYHSELVANGVNARTIIDNQEMSKHIDQI